MSNDNPSPQFDIPAPILNRTIIAMRSYTRNNVPYRTHVDTLNKFLSNLAESGWTIEPPRPKRYRAEK